VRIVAIATAMRTIFPIDMDSGFISSGFDTADTAAIFKAYDQAIDRIEKAGKQVVFVVDNPTFPDPRSCISGGATSSPLLNLVLRRRENTHCSLRYSDHLAGTAAYVQFVKQLKERHPDMLIFDQAPLLCDVDLDLCLVTRDGNYLYSYGDHISDFANSMLGQALIRSLHVAARLPIPSHASSGR
jgi:hypothetical protein